MAVLGTLPGDGGSETEPIVRPGFGHFVWYCYGGALPDVNHTWVLRDVTCRTWVVRHFARWFMVIVPVFGIYFAILPASFGTRLYTDAALCGSIFLFALVNILIDTDRRAVRAGFGFSRPGQIRNARSVDHQRVDNRARRQRIADRQARRRR